MIDVYRGKAGRVGIDACAPLALVAEMLAVLPANAASALYVNQPSEGGMVAIGVEVLAPVARGLLAAAENAGAIIRR